MTTQNEHKRPPESQKSSARDNELHQPAAVDFQYQELKYYHSLLNSLKIWIEALKYAVSHKQRVFEFAFRRRLVATAIRKIYHKFKFVPRVKGKIRSSLLSSSFVRRIWRWLDEGPECAVHQHSRKSKNLVPEHNDQKKKGASEVTPQHAHLMDYHRDTLQAFGEFRIDKNSTIDANDDWLVFAAYCPFGTLSMLQLEQLELYKSAGFKILLVVNSGHFEKYRNVDNRFADAILVRQNIGFDFGGWMHALELFVGLNFVRSIYFQNDCVIPRSVEEISRVKYRIDSSEDDAVFLMCKGEIERSYRNYCFCLKGSSNLRLALDYLRALSAVWSKTDYNSAMELFLCRSFEELGLATTILGASSDLQKKPPKSSRRGWDEFPHPFVSVQEMTSPSGEPVEAAVVVAFGGLSKLTMIRDHLKERLSTGVIQLETESISDVHTPVETGHYFLNSSTIQNAEKIPVCLDHTIELPLQDVDALPPNAFRILLVVHCFYIDVAERILELWCDVDIPSEILLTTNSPKKQRQLYRIAVRLGLKVNVVICPNRGRDIAPFLVEGAAAAFQSDLVLHLHTKKSPYGSSHDDWGDYLFQSLIGSPEIVRSIIQLFIESSKLGVVFPDHHRSVRDLRNWGRNYPKAHKLLSNVGVEITSRTILEFPSGSMFWARPEAIRQLFEYDLSYADFEPEAGQIDGTLAHSIERMVLFVAEHNRFSWIKIGAVDNAHLNGTKTTSLKTSELNCFLQRASFYLLEYANAVGFQGLTVVEEIFPVSATYSETSSTRLNILVPTISIEKNCHRNLAVFDVVHKLVNSLECEDIRIVVTEKSLDRLEIEALSEKLKLMLVRCHPNDDISGVSIVGLGEDRHIPLVLRARDVFFSTTWCTENLRKRLTSYQLSLHGAAPRSIFHIQEFEPGLHEWGNRHALAIASYQDSRDFVALINTEELANFLMDQHRFSHAYVIPCAIDAPIEGVFSEKSKEPSIVIYARPEVAQECFEIVVEGVRMWQQKDPVRNCAYRVVFVGESFSENLVADLDNVQIMGQSLHEEYFRLLEESAIGISMMVGPQPSFPALEMAQAGCVTLTNKYYHKDLTARHINVLNVQSVTPNGVLQGLIEAIKILEIGHKTPHSAMFPIECATSTVDYDELASFLMSNIDLFG